MGTEWHPVPLLYVLAFEEGPLEKGLQITSPDQLLPSKLKSTGVGTSPVIAVVGRELKLCSDLHKLHLASTCRAQTPASPRLLLSSGSHEALNRWLAPHQVSVLDGALKASHRAQL